MLLITIFVTYLKERKRRIVCLYDPIKIKETGYAIKIARRTSRY